MTDSPPAETRKPGPSRRAIIGWTVAMLVVLGLAWFAGAVAWPLVDTHRALREWAPPLTPLYRPLPSGPPPEKSSDPTYWYDPRHRATHPGSVVILGDRRLPSLLQRLGGPERAAARLERYLRLPEALVPGEKLKAQAVYALESCGERGSRALVRALGNPDWEIRARAAMALAETSPPVPEAGPELERLCSDNHEVVCWSAAAALKRIRAKSSPESGDRSPEEK
jgi:hypothetical protein